MTRKIIHHENYQGEDRRKSMIEGELKPLGETFKSWAPIWVSLIGVCVTIIGFVVATTIFAQTTKATTLLATDTVKRVDTIERRDIVSDNRIANLEGYYRDILVKFDKLDIRLARMEDKLPR